jgi:hypothetical protein
VATHHGSKTNMRSALSLRCIKDPPSRQPVGANIPWQSLGAFPPAPSLERLQLTSHYDESEEETHHDIGGILHDPFGVCARIGLVEENPTHSQADALTFDSVRLPFFESECNTTSKL